MSRLSAPGGRAPSPAGFRGVMGRFATGVTVMTTVVDGVPHGMTANAITSVSLDPLLVLVSVERRTVMADQVVRSQAFALSFLTTEQGDLSDRFADGNRPSGAAQFEGLVTDEAPTGSPLLVDTLAWLDCEVWAVYDGGDHILVLGEVVALAEGERDDPLLYYRGTYRSVADLPRPA